MSTINYPCVYTLFGAFMYILLYTIADVFSFCRTLLSGLWRGRAKIQFLLNHAIGLYTLWPLPVVQTDIQLLSTVMWLQIWYKRQVHTSLKIYPTSVVKKKAKTKGIWRKCKNYERGQQKVMPRNERNYNSTKKLEVKRNELCHSSTFHVVLSYEVNALLWASRSPFPQENSLVGS